MLIWLVPLVLALAYLGAILFVARVSLHPPRIPLFCSPGIFGAPQEEVVLAPEPGIELPAWWVLAENPRAIAVLAHGYAMNRSELAPVAFRLWQSGVSCLLFDFRAHGGAKGGFSTIGWRERADVAAAARCARSKHPDLPLVLIGSSMGSAASAFALAEDGSLAEGLVLDSSYSLLANAVPGWWRFLGGRTLQVFLWPVLPIASLMAGIKPRRIDVAEALRRIDKPVLVLHGDLDDLARRSEADRNLRALPSGSPVVWLGGCGHTEGRWLLPELYSSSIESFIDSIVARGP